MSLALTAIAGAGLVTTRLEAVGQGRRGGPLGAAREDHGGGAIAWPMQIV